MVTRLDQGPPDPGPPEPRRPDGLSVVLTPMRRRHIRGVMRIETQVYPRPWSSGLFAGEIAMADSRIYLVARIDARVVGYGGVMVAGHDGHVTNLAVDPLWHRRGIATRMLLELVRRAAARSVEQMSLEARLSNRGAQDLYRKFGFVPAGIHRGYYVDNDEDALVMWAHDVGSASHAERLAQIEAGLVGMTVVEGSGKA